MHNESKLPLDLISPLMMKRILVIGEGQELHHKHRYKSPPRRGLGNDAISKALNQISRLPFTRRIEGAILPQQSHHPMFTIYNGWTDPVEHVSHFN